MENEKDNAVIVLLAVGALGFILWQRSNAGSSSQPSGAAQAPQDAAAGPGGAAFVPPQAYVPGNTAPTSAALPTRAQVVAAMPIDRWGLPHRSPASVAQALTWTPPQVLQMRRLSDTMRIYVDDIYDVLQFSYSIGRGYDLGQMIADLAQQPQYFIDLQQRYNATNPPVPIVPRWV